MLRAILVLAFVGLVATVHSFCTKKEDCMSANCSHGELAECLMVNSIGDSNGEKQCVCIPNGKRAETRQAEAAAFTAYHARDETLSAGDVLKFSDILYNKGYMYNPSTGVATVPLSGTYLFSVTIEHWHTQELRCYLRVDGINQVDVIIYPAGRSTQSSNTAVLGLTSGQRVWVSCDDGHVFGAQGFRGTTFTGAFLY